MNIFCFAGDMVFIVTTQLDNVSVKVAIGNKLMSAHVYNPIKLYLQKHVKAWF